MKQLLKSRRRAWQTLREQGAVAGFLVDCLGTDAECEQLTNELSDLEDGKVRIIRMIELAAIAETTVDLDALAEGQEVPFTISNVEGTPEGFPLLLQADGKMPLLMRMFGLYASNPDRNAANVEIPVAVFYCNHLLDWHKPVCMADVINRTIRVHSKGELTVLDGWNESIEQTEIFAPQDWVKIIRLQDVAITVYAKFFEERSLHVVIRKETTI